MWHWFPDPGRCRYRVRDIGTDLVAFGIANDGTVAGVVHRGKRSAAPDADVGPPASGGDDDAGIPITDAARDAHAAFAWRDGEVHLIRAPDAVSTRAKGSAISAGRRVVAALLLAGAMSRAVTEPLPRAIPRTPRPSQVSKGIERISNPFAASGSSGLWNTYRGWRATIWYAPGGTASPRALLSSDWRGVIQTDYSASPDGRWVVIEMSGVGYMRILLRRPGGYVLRPLNPPPQFAAGGCPVWPDSRHCLFYCSSGAGTQGECWAYYPAEEAWRCVGRASNPESWMVRHDPVLRKSVIALRRFKHLPAAVVDDPVEALMRQDDWGNWPCAAAVFRGGKRAAVSFYDGIAHRWRVQVFDRRSAAPLARFSIAGAALFPGDPPSSPPSTHAWLSQLRIIDANDIGFTVVKLHLEGGVGGSRWDWDSQVHPSRFRAQICEWNLKTGRVHTLGEGQDPLALPQPVVRRLLTRATGLVRAGRARSHPHRDPFSLS